MERPCPRHGRARNPEKEEGEAVWIYTARAGELLKSTSYLTWPDLGRVPHTPNSPKHIFLSQFLKNSSLISQDLLDPILLLSKTWTFVLLT